LLDELFFGNEPFARGRAQHHDMAAAIFHHSGE
jgi:hypothetical protein